MARYGGNNYGPSIGDMTVGDYANAMPNIRLGEMFRSFGRQLPWLIFLLVIGSGLAWYLTKDIKRTFEGAGSIYVQQGEEHTFTPIGGGAGSSILQGPEAITHAEVAIMKNNEVIERVIGQMVAKYGESRFDKNAFERINSATRSGDAPSLADARVKLHQAVDNAFWVSPRPKTGIIDLGYKHEDGEIAVDTLNTFIDEYLAYRRNIFVDGSADVFQKQATAVEEQLNQVEKDIQSFLRRNGISSFDSERAGASERTEALRAELNSIKAQTAETEAAMATVEGQLRGTNASVVTRRTHLDKQRISQAELELQQLLAKYLPNSDPVRAKRAEIGELRALQSSSTEHIGGEETGPNPVHQALVTRLNELRASADSLREREFSITRLLGDNDSKVKKLQTLSPEYNNLLRLRETLDLRLKGVNSKLQEAQVNQEQAEAANVENVKVIAYATLPRKGRNMAKIMWALITIGWAFTLFMVALLRVFLDPRLYTDPTRRMRTRPEVAGYASDDWGVDVPTRNPAQPYVPEPVQPAAAHYQDPYAQPHYQPQPYQAQPYQAQPYQSPPAYPATQQAPYVDPYSNPYAQPEVQTIQPGTGPLPSSELG